MLVMIVAMNKHRTIGLDGSMPWRNKEDLAHFRKTTMGHTLVMGRKTVDGLPKSLDGRNIVTVTRDNTLPNAIHDLKLFCEEHQNSSEVIYIAGGGEIYKTCLPYTKQVLVSLIHDNDVVGDTFFPSLDEDFRLVTTQKFNTFTLQLFEREEQIV